MIGSCGDIAEQPVASEDSYHHYQDNGCRGNQGANAVRTDNQQK